MEPEITALADHHQFPPEGLLAGAVRLMIVAFFIDLKVLLLVL